MDNEEILFRRQIFIPIRESQATLRQAWRSNNGHLVYNGQCKRRIDEKHCHLVKRRKNNQ